MECEANVGVGCCVGVGTDLGVGIVGVRMGAGRGGGASPAIPSALRGWEVA